MTPEEARKMADALDGQAYPSLSDGNTAQALRDLAGQLEALLAADKAGGEQVEQAYQDGKAYAESYWSARIEPSRLEAASYKEAYFKLLEQIANLKAFETSTNVFLYTHPQPQAVPDDVVKDAELTEKELRRMLW